MAPQNNDTLVKLGDTGQTVANPDEDVRGRMVKDAAGTDVGKVEDLIVDNRDQKVRFLLVAHGGFLGIGETKSFIPVDAVTRITDDDIYIDHSAEHVTNAPRYQPDLTDEETYHDSVYGYYGYTPYWNTDYTHPRFPYYGYGGPRPQAELRGHTDRR